MCPHRGRARPHRGRARGGARLLGVSRQRVTGIVPTLTSSPGRSQGGSTRFRRPDGTGRRGPWSSRCPPGRAGARPHSLSLKFTGWRAAGLILKDEAAFSALSPQVSTEDGGRGRRTETWAHGGSGRGAHRPPEGTPVQSCSPGLAVTGRRAEVPRRPPAVGALLAHPHLLSPVTPAPLPVPLLLVPDQDARVSPPWPVAPVCPVGSTGEDTGPPASPLPAGGTRLRTGPRARLRLSPLKPSQLPRDAWQPVSPQVCLGASVVG